MIIEDNKKQILSIHQYSLKNKKVLSYSFKKKIIIIEKKCII